jgi:hypothetical protein
VGGGGIITGLASAKCGAPVGGCGIITGLAKAAVAPATRRIAETEKIKRIDFEDMGLRSFEKPLQEKATPKVVPGPPQKLPFFSNVLFVS